MSIRAIFIAGAALTAAGPSLGATLDVSFTGTAFTVLGTASSQYADGAAVNGSFLINTATGAISDMTLGAFAAPPSSGSNGVGASLSPTDAIFSQGIFASGNDPANNSITVDFSALNSFSGSDPVAFLLQGNAALAQQIDFTGAASQFPSVATYYLGDSHGNNVSELSAYLTGVSVSTVPLPAAVWLLCSSLIGLLPLARRRSAV